MQQLPAPATPPPAAATLPRVADSPPTLPLVIPSRSRLLLPSASDPSIAAEPLGSLRDTLSLLRQRRQRSDEDLAPPAAAAAAAAAAAPGLKRSGSFRRVGARPPATAVAADGSLPPPPTDEDLERYATVKRSASYRRLGARSPAPRPHPDPILPDNRLAPAAEPPSAAAASASASASAPDPAAADPADPADPAPRAASPPPLRRTLSRGRARGLPADAAPLEDDAPWNRVDPDDPQPALARSRSLRRSLSLKRSGALRRSAQDSPDPPAAADPQTPPSGPAPLRNPAPSRPYTSAGGPAVAAPPQMPPSDQDAPSSSAASSNPIATLVRRLSRKRTKQPRADTPPPVPVAEMSISGPTLVSVTKGVDLLEQLQRGQLPAVLAPAQDTTPPWNRPDADSSPLNSSALSIARRPRLLPDPAPVASAAPLLPMPDLASQILDDLLSGDPDDAADAGPPAASVARSPWAAAAAAPRAARPVPPARPPTRPAAASPASVAASAAAAPPTLPSSNESGTLTRRRASGSVRRSMVRSGTGAGATAAADLAPDARAGAPIQDSPQLFRSHTLSSGSAPNEVQRHFVQMLAVAVTTSKAAAEALSVADGDARPTVSLKVSRTVDFASVLDKLALRFAAHEAASPAWKRFPGHFGKQVVAIQNITYKDADGHLINIQDEEDWAVCLDEAVLQGGITLFVDIETVLAREA